METRRQKKENNSSEETLELEFCISKKVLQMESNVN
jgi:hypothetical protein